MTHGFARLRQFGALSAVIALFTSPIASAQAPVPAPTGDAPSTIVLNAAAFARLVKVTPPDAGSAPHERNANAPARLESLPHSPMVTARRADAAAAKPPARSRSTGQKVVVVLAVVGMIAGALAISIYTGADFDQMLEGLFQWASK